MNKLTNASFSQLVVQYERLVYTVCFQLVGDAAAAEDLTALCLRHPAPMGAAYTAKPVFPTSGAK